ncbi:hypothetical protein [Bacteroides sp. 224]|uniref:hypothetical protein n=1 Tax=Bacteroides sp. 224 TaxID=2302936 RepID=UPI0013D487F0|nr:hypothetical protein [Bacteroides sp. 224]NDV67014.1 hypothetical protein [Bacteroides sp. 224]
MSISKSFKEQYSISDLKKYTQSQTKIFQKNVYTQSKILIIDDKIKEHDYPFTRSIHFLKEQCNCNIHIKTDLENLTDAEAFHIIICDNDQVGKILGGKKGDGIWLLNKLYREYPEKKYILFSDKDTGLHRITAIKKAELWSKRDLITHSGTEKGFSEEVQRVLNDYADPSKKWEDIRRELLEEGVSIHSVAQLESAYVKSIIKKNEKLFINTSKKIDTTDIMNERDINIHQVISSASKIIGTTISLLALL